MLERYREEVGPRLQELAEPFLGFRPDHLSWTSLALSAAAALFLVALRFVSPSAPWVPILFFDVAALIFLGGVFDALDGYVARRQGVSSQRGDLLDHVLDRYADMLVMVGLSLSGWVDPYLALFALTSLLLAGYMGTQAQAVTGRRLYRGLLGRADRIVLLSFGALVMSILSAWNLFMRGALEIPLWGRLLGWSFSPLDFLLLYFVIAGQVTAVYRAIVTWRLL